MAIGMSLALFRGPMTLPAAQEGGQAHCWSMMRIALQFCGACSLLQSLLQYRSQHEISGSEVGEPELG